YRAPLLRPMAAAYGSTATAMRNRARRERHLLSRYHEIEHLKSYLPPDGRSGERTRRWPDAVVCAIRRNYANADYLPELWNALRGRRASDHRRRSPTATERDVAVGAVELCRVPELRRGR